jgi:MtN3 and saliva related transmembrane protein
MYWVNFLGLVAGSLTTLAFLPQLHKTWKTKSAKDISLWWLGTFSTGIFLWLLYGICIGALPVILSNGITLVLTFVILLLKLRFR